VDLPPDSILKVEGVRFSRRTFLMFDDDFHLRDWTVFGFDERLQEILADVPCVVLVDHLDRRAARVQSAESSRRRGGRSH